MIFNLAPFKYRRVLEKNGGPIGKIDFYQKEIRTGEYGFEVSACLLGEYLHPLRKGSFGTGESDGLGSHQSKAIATHKAVSEALERWAYYATVDSGEKEKYGFHIDQTTTGMAAYPGLFKTEVRHIAYAEALERYALESWWEGELPARRKIYKKGIEAFEIMSFNSYKSTAVLWTHCPFRGDCAYGFASGADFEEACLKAEVELFRNLELLQKDALYQERLKFLSTIEGHQKFLETLAQSENLHSVPRAPKLLVDQEIIGPWSKYTTVWRCLLESSIN